jgi:SAM-dependent methyltransferase
LDLWCLPFIGGRRVANACGWRHASSETWQQKDRPKTADRDKELTMTNASQTVLAQVPHTCPVWIGYLLASPVRRLFENPNTLVLPLVKPGYRVLELGPGLGFFTVPVAKAVQAGGKVVCVDVQGTMLARLGKRLDRRGLRDRVELRQCSHDDLGLANEYQTCDLALALHVVHETPSPSATIRTLAACLKPGGQLLLVEPSGHCSRDLWREESAAAEKAGLVGAAHPQHEGRKQLALWSKPAVVP